MSAEPLTRSHGDLLEAAQTMLDNTGQTLAELNIARSVRHSATQVAFLAAARHLLPFQVRKARVLAVQESIKEMGNVVNDQQAVNSVAGAYLRATNAVGADNLVGGGVGGEAIDAVQVASRIQDGVHENHTLHQFLANDMGTWVKTMARMYNLAEGNAAFAAEFKPALTSAMARMEMIMDGQASRLSTLTDSMDTLFGGAIKAGRPIQLRVMVPRA
jgi:hypothetical protein